jgi:neutral ceramidase
VIRQTSVLLLSAVAILQAAGYKAGTARANITPDKPIYLSGYASRTHPSEGTGHEIWAKALAIEDARGGRVVIVTTDLIGLPRSISDVVAARVQKQYGLDRAQLLLNSSHTHTGPMVRGNLDIMFELKPEERAVVDEYGSRLTETLVAIVGSALGQLAPANLSFGHSTAGFAVNRREPTPQGVKIGVNPSGPVDRDVPVLKVTSPEGRIVAVLFGYACHNTTLGGDFYQVTGDYAGFAQTAVEQAHPGATAMFLMLCGADANPNPRGELEQARRYGQELAGAVDKALAGAMDPVRGRIRTAFQITELGFAPQSRDVFEARVNDSNVWRARHAKAMLRAMDDRTMLRRYPYPVEAIAFGRDLVIVALGGEVVVDYALRTQREFGQRGLIVAAYSNDVMSYIPSLRVLKEGGYEPVDSMIYYGLPGPYSEDVEERVFGAIRNVMARVGRKPISRSAGLASPRRSSHPSVKSSGTKVGFRRSPPA